MNLPSDLMDMEALNSYTQFVELSSGILFSREEH